MAQTWREFRLLYRWLQLLPATEVSRGPTISWRGCSCLDLKGILQTLKPGHQLLGRPLWTNCQLLESDLGCSHPWPVVPATGASGVFYSQLWGWTGIFSQKYTSVSEAGKGFAPSAGAGAGPWLADCVPVASCSRDWVSVSSPDLLCMSVQ